MESIHLIGIPIGQKGLSKASRPLRSSLLVERIAKRRPSKTHVKVKNTTGKSKFVEKPWMETKIVFEPKQVGIVNDVNLEGFLMANKPLVSGRSSSTVMNVRLL